MRNRIVGLLVIGISILIGFIIFSFNTALRDIVNSQCSHGPTCPMWGTIDFQTNISIGIMAFVIIIGLYLVFFGEEEKIVTRIKKVKEQIGAGKITKGNYKKAMKSLSRDEKLCLEKIIEAEGAIFQSDLVEKTLFAKVKVTRILDKMEGRGIIERHRRGMTNVVILRKQ